MYYCLCVIYQYMAYSLELTMSPVEIIFLCKNVMWQNKIITIVERSFYVFGVAREFMWNRDISRIIRSKTLQNILKTQYNKKPDS